jgi:nucleotide-binding universal stress UspA family protein
MLPPKKILCPTDFTDHSLEALAIADQLAGHFSAELLVAYIMGPIPVPPVIPGVQASTFNLSEYSKELEAASLQAMEKIIEQRVSLAPTVRTIVEQGEAGSEIVRVAEEEAVDLIVVSTHGTSGLDRAFFGAVAEEAVRRAHCAVLTIRTDGREKTRKQKTR